MFTRKEKAENCYYPAFLRIDVETCEDLTQLGHQPLDDRTEAAFLHEYIHNLQDITTLCGYMKIGTVVDQMKWVIADRKGKLRIPYDPKSTYSNNMCSNAMAMDLSSGDFAFRDAKGNRIRTDISAINSFTLTQRHIPVPTRPQKYVAQEAVLEFVDQNRVMRSFSVGEFAISESMAYLIESAMYPGVLPTPPDCPYRIVEKIIAKESPALLSPLLMISICDVALNFPFPGYAFYELIHKLKNVTHITPKMIYDFWQNGMFDYIAGNNICWNSNLDSACQLATEQIQDYFLHEYWKDTKDAVALSFSMGRTVRENDPLFFVRIASNGAICSNRPFLDTLSKCGSLCVCTPNGLYSFQPNFTSLNIRPESFVCLSEIYYILLTNSAVHTTPSGDSIAFRCQLKEWCSRSFNKQGIRDITDISMNCVESPWCNNDPNIRPQCEFARLWYAYKLGKPYLRR